MVTTLLSFLFNFTIILILARLVYYPFQREKDYFFTYLCVGTIVFLLCSFLSNVKLELGFALGLFAIFGILRYRTEILPIKEMTYLFVVIGLSVINSLVNFYDQWLLVLIGNIFVVGMSYFLEAYWVKGKSITKYVQFEKIEHVHESQKKELKKEIEKRTGWNIQNITIENVDFVKDTMKLKIEILPSNNA